MTYITYRLGGNFRRMKLHLWGNAANPALVCVHGLTLAGHEFDHLATALSDRYYVIAPDLPGRGESDWLDQPQLYNPLAYCDVLGHLLAWLNRPVDWVGSSLGGICGMILAAGQNTPIKRLVLNDVGPFIPKAAMEQIANYIEAPAHFSDLDEAEAYLRQTRSGFAPLSDQAWKDFARWWTKPANGGFTAHYDPKIAVPVLASPPADVNLWPVYRAVTCPRLVIRGANSGLLLPETLAEMTAEGAESWLVPGAGHVPSLHDEASQNAIARFLTR